jgi:hypothetical protein
MRFRAGGKVEMLLVAPLLTIGTLALAVYVVPGALELALSVRDQAVRLLPQAG